MRRDSRGESVDLQEIGRKREEDGEYGSIFCIISAKTRIFCKNAQKKADIKIIILKTIETQSKV